MTTIRTTYKGRTIEIVPPAGLDDAPTFTVNDSAHRIGRPFIGTVGQAPADCLTSICRTIDEKDEEGINGTPAYAFWYNPDTWETCPNSVNQHIKPTNAPCNNPRCKTQAARNAARNARRAKGNPSAPALSAQLARAGFERSNSDRLSAGFRAMKIRGDVHIVWYRDGARMPLDRAPGRLPEIADFLRAKGKYAIHYDGGSTITVTTKTTR